MKLFTFLLFVFSFSSIVNAQVLAPRPVNVKVYSKNGEKLTKSTKKYISYFEYDHYGKTNSIKSESIKDENGFTTNLDYGDIFKIIIKHNKETMTIHTSESLDSIPFMNGDFYFNRSIAYLTKIVPGNDVSIDNLNWDFFKKQNSKFPYFEMEENEEDEHLETPKCYRMADKIEEKHGGKNWARNVCNDIYEEPVISDNIILKNRMDSIVSIRSNDKYSSIYPLSKNRFIKHDFYSSEGYDHVISLSEDGISWKKILTLKDEWYVNLIFFPNEDKIGIDISNSGVVLVSDLQLNNWKFYVQNLEDEEENVKGKTDAFVFSGGNWMDAYPVKFNFKDL